MVYIIGIGMDGGKTITEEALSAIEKSDIIIGAERMLKPFQMFNKTSFCSWKSSEIADLLRSENYTNAA
ncbi:MAG: bifunctional cobalt-precorrin-7 (C(5))-methyltransferase/cobalt-precorrin-6B (C(15))-methyltransferase, partial [Oscillospiraceae bacterium]